MKRKVDQQAGQTAWGSDSAVWQPGQAGGKIRRPSPPAKRAVPRRKMFIRTGLLDIGAAFGNRSAPLGRRPVRSAPPERRGLARASFALDWRDIACDAGRRTISLRRSGAYMTFR